MASRKRNAKRKNKSAVSFLLLLLAVVAVVCGRFTDDFETEPLTSPENTYVSDGIVTVHILDVGQGSSALIQSGITGILIDGGEKEYGKEIVSYISKAGVQKLEYVIASHPHTDHIGGLLTVLDAFETENIIMPRLTEENTPTTKTYENFLLKIDEKNINVIAAKYGQTYEIENAVLQILGPVAQLDDLNDMSVICKVKALSTTFLFPGDAEKEELKSVYALGADFSCDIMAAAHHGSSTSLYEPYLEKAKPSVVVFSCGKDNSYGHPHEETVSYFEKIGSEIYRTDYAGNVIFTCNADGYKIDTKLEGE